MHCGIYDASTGINVHHQLIMDCCQRCASIRKAIAYTYAFDSFSTYRRRLFKVLHEEEQLLEVLKSF